MSAQAKRDLEVPPKDNETSPAKLNRDPFERRSAQFLVLILSVRAARSGPAAEALTC